MIAPAFLQSLYDAGWMPFVIFMLFSESILFMIALNKNWYRVNKRKVFIGIGIGFIAVITYFFGSMTADYQKARIQAWLSHWGLNFGSIDGNTIKYMNYNTTCLDNIFLRSNFIGKSDSAIEAVQLTPEASVDYILASIAATCGKLTVAVIMISLIILAVYVFRISVKQKNSLGSIVGCSCGIVIAGGFEYFDCIGTFSVDRDYASFFQSRHHQYHNRLHPPRPCPVNLQIPGHPRGKRACNYIIGIIRKIFDINPGDNLIVP